MADKQSIVAENKIIQPNVAPLIEIVTSLLENIKLNNNLDDLLEETKETEQNDENELRLIELKRLIDYSKTRQEQIQSRLTRIQEEIQSKLQMTQVMNNIKVDDTNNTNKNEFVALKGLKEIKQQVKELKDQENNENANLEKEKDNNKKLEQQLSRLKAKTIKNEVLNIIDNTEKKPENIDENQNFVINNKRVKFDEFENAAILDQLNRSLQKLTHSSIESFGNERNVIKSVIERLKKIFDTQANQPKIGTQQQSDIVNNKIKDLFKYISDNKPYLPHTLRNFIQNFNINSNTDNSTMFTNLITSISTDVNSMISEINLNLNLEKKIPSFSLNGLMSKIKNGYKNMKDYSDGVSKPSMFSKIKNPLTWINNYFNPKTEDEEYDDEVDDDEVDDEEDEDGDDGDIEDGEEEDDIEDDDNGEGEDDIEDDDNGEGDDDNGEGDGDSGEEDGNNNDDENVCKNDSTDGIPIIEVGGKILYYNKDNNTYCIKYSKTGKDDGDDEDGDSVDDKDGDSVDDEDGDRVDDEDGDSVDDEEKKKKKKKKTKQEKKTKTKHQNM